MGNTWLGIPKGHPALTSCSVSPEMLIAVGLEGTVTPFQVSRVTVYYVSRISIKISFEMMHSLIFRRPTRLLEVEESS